MGHFSMEIFCAAGSLLSGNQQIDDLQKAAGATRGLVHGDMSQEETRAIMKLLPFNNAFGILQATNAGMGALGMRERTPSGRKQLVGLFGD